MPPPDGHHCHKCPACGQVWEHADSCAGDAEKHRCPTPGCGVYTYHRYHEEEEEEESTDAQTEQTRSHAA